MREYVILDTFADIRNVSALLKRIGYNVKYTASDDLKFILYYEKREIPIKLDIF